MTGKEHRVCKLQKSIYRLKQISWQWYFKFNEVGTGNGFKENVVISAYTSGSMEAAIYILVLYVDVILLALKESYSNFSLKIIFDNTLGKTSAQ